LGGDNTVHKTNTQLRRGTIAKNEAENNIVSYPYIRCIDIAEFCDSVDRAAITERATRWKSTTLARTEDRGLSMGSSSEFIYFAVGCSASRSTSNTSQSTIENRLSVV
jgi:hypothetical protein